MDIPDCRLTGEDGNVFNIIGRVCKALKANGMKDRADEFRKRAFSLKSYNEVLVLCHEYVNIR